MAEVKLPDISYRSGPSMSVELDAVPIGPGTYREGMSYNYYSNDLSADAIAGVPPRSTAHVGSGVRRPVSSPHLSPQIQRQSPVQIKPVQNTDTEQQVKKSFGSSVQHDDISLRNSRPQQVPSEKETRYESDLESSYGSSFGSMESCSSVASNWEDELQYYKDKMPTEIREDYYDAMILYTESDYQGAEAFRQHLMNDIRDLPYNEKCRALLYNAPELVGLSGSSLQSLDLSMQRCTYVFIYMTKDFIQDKWCTFSSESCLMRAIYDEERRWCVVPIYTQRRNELDFIVPMGLNSLKGINYYCNDEFYRRGVSRLIGDKIYHRLRLQKKHKIKQKEWLENHKRELIKAEEQSKRIAAQEENLTLELLRKIGYLPDSEVFPNQHANIHNSYSESQLSSKEYSFPHSASSGSLKPVVPQNPAVAQLLEAYKHLCRTAGQSGNPTPERPELLYSRHLEPDGNHQSSPGPLSDKFQGLHLGSQNSSCSADIGVRSETSRVPGEVELNISPEHLEYLQSLHPDEQKKCLESLLASQDVHLQYQQVPSHQTGPHANDVPNFDLLLSLISQQPSLSGHQPSHASHVSQQSEDSSCYSSYSSSSPDNSGRFENSQRTSGHSQGNLPTGLLEDSNSVIDEDGGSLAEQGNDWTIVNHDQVPQVREDRKMRSKAGKKNKKGRGKDIEMVETRNKKGQVVHQTIYHIYSPKAVQIGDENVVQEVNGKTAEDDDDEVDNETKVKGEGQEVSTDEVKGQGEIFPEDAEGKKRVRSCSDEEDSNKSQREMNTEQIPGEMTDGTVAMDAAPSSAGSFNIGDETSNIDPNDFKDKGALSRPVKDATTDNSSTISPVTGMVRPALPVKPVLPTKPNTDNHMADKDQTYVKPKVKLPVRNQEPDGEDTSNKSNTSPRIIKKVLERPMAKIGPSVFRPDPEDVNTNPKTVIQSEETAVKCPVTSNIIQGQAHTQTEQASLEGDLDQTLVKTAHKTEIASQKTTIQSLMPIQALERSGQGNKSDLKDNNDKNCKVVEESRERPLFQAPPFSMSRHSDATTLFYWNRLGIRGQTDQFENSLDSLDEPVAISNLNFPDQIEADNLRDLGGLTPQSVPLGEDPLSRAQETMGFVPNESSDLDTNDLEYDFMEDSSESCASQPTRISKLGRILGSLRGRPT